VEIQPLPKDFAGGAYNSGAYIFVVLPDRLVKDYWYVVETITHESVHVFQKAMAYCEEETLGAETQAYHISHIATTLLKEYVKREGL
jgi:hypothetical protein